ncbi:hypothetical protein AVEN_27892-1 [Araneus ventricosus]|uniref:Uncharacterized protein n=1 Tax=Araneus ventricosus TaxID=182803 RepID=A0A4Y2MBU2_ARAVE|nr:hypothetical protein AVEN_27892-1 [Araneus ventricosus]
MGAAQFKRKSTSSFFCSYSPQSKRAVSSSYCNCEKSEFCITIGSTVESQGRTQTLFKSQAVPKKDHVWSVVVCIQYNPSQFPQLGGTAAENYCQQIDEMHRIRHGMYPILVNRKSPFLQDNARPDNQPSKNETN